MTREYDAHSKVPNDEYRDNYDRIFGKKPSRPATVAYADGRHSVTANCALSGCTICRARLAEAK